MPYIGEKTHVKDKNFQQKFKIKAIKLWEYNLKKKKKNETVLELKAKK